MLNFSSPKAREWNFHCIAFRMLSISIIKCNCAISGGSFETSHVRAFTTFLNRLIASSSISLNYLLILHLIDSTYLRTGISCIFSHMPNVYSKTRFFKLQRIKHEIGIQNALFCWINIYCTHVVFIPRFKMCNLLATISQELPKRFKYQNWTLREKIAVGMGN